jgi:pimeloyl-ACP methyl ester carboxylesterase
MAMSRDRNPYALLEAPRALAEFGMLPWAQPLLGLTPMGDGHTVLVLPGFGGSDRSTWPLRQFLRSRNYWASGWKQGRNLGLHRLGGITALVSLLDLLFDESGQKVSLIGWSLGGVQARRLAARSPEKVRQVICLGSPIQAAPVETPAYRLYETINGIPTTAPSEQLSRGSLNTLAVPCSSIYSRSDGIVPWQFSLEHVSPQSENIEVFGSHLGLGVNAAVFYILANRLAQMEGHWQPFEPNLLTDRVALGLLEPLAPLFGQRVF